MRKTLLIAFGFLVVVACKKDDPPPQTPPTGPGVPGGPGAVGPCAPGQPGCNPQTPPNYTPPGNMPPNAGPAQTLAVPGPTALQCTSDANCFTHKCNLQYGKCAFPCASNFDCSGANTCFPGLPTGAACLPAPPTH